MEQTAAAIRRLLWVGGNLPALKHRLDDGFVGLHVPGGYRDLPAAAFSLPNTLDRLRRLAEREGKPVRVETLTARDPSALGHLERHFFGRRRSRVRREASNISSLLSGSPAYLSRRSDILEKPALSLLTGALAAVGGGYEYGR